MNPEPKPLTLNPKAKPFRKVFGRQDTAPMPKKSCPLGHLVIENKKRVEVEEDQKEPSHVEKGSVGGIVCFPMLPGTLLLGP